MRYEIFDAMARLDEMTSLAEAQAFIAEKIAEYGFGSVVICKLPAADENLRDTLYMINRPAGWAERYVEENQHINDPVVLETQRSTGAFTWNSILTRPPMPLADRSIMVGARDFRLNNGYYLPIREADGYIGVVSYATELETIPDESLRFANLFGIVAHAKLRELTRAEQTTPPLSNREREVLSWVAIGKTDDEIGAILGLSARTVHFYVERAKTKLNATTRIYAVVQAIRLGEIHI